MPTGRKRGAPPRRDLAGVRFGRLVAMDDAGTTAGSRNRCWRCLCDCGEVVVVVGSSLVQGKTSSCGCLQRELVAAKMTTHGHARLGRKTPEYLCWKHMRRRCHDPKSKSYVWYGARGISVCDRWRDDFEAFFADMGPRPSPRHSIDRINNDGNYEPSNCRWATPVEQANNRRPRARRAA